MKNKDKDKRKYVKPEIIYEGLITTRAGSGCEKGCGDKVLDPADLFGE